MASLKIRAMVPEDCLRISEAFATQGWNKPVEQYRKYYHLQQEGTRDVLLAERNGTFAGYLTIQWVSHYRPFREAAIPEIVDFNVLIKYQRQGIGTALMDEAEERIRRVSKRAGIGFGITRDYGPAQILYIRRGYIPDGRGLIKDSISLTHGQHVEINDDLIIYLTKLL